MRFIRCWHCGKRIYEGEECFRQRGHATFYCSTRCYALDTKEVEMLIMSDKMLKEDEMIEFR